MFKQFNSVSIIFVMCMTIMSCSKTEIKEPIEYKGPIRIGENVEMFYTEHEQIKVKMNAEEVHEFISGDREFPKGIHLEFYDEAGKLESTLRANHAYYFKKENQWRGRGKVEVKNIAKDEQLNTEELFWNPGTKKIFTDKFVTIRQQEDVVYGTGLEAEQDMSDWEILDVQADFAISDEQ
jgi:LPS export ABC transporter protein LptC